MFRRDPADDEDVMPDFRGQVKAVEAFAKEEREIFERANNWGEGAPNADLGTVPGNRRWDLHSAYSEEDAADEPWTDPALMEVQGIIEVQGIGDTRDRRSTPRSGHNTAKRTVAREPMPKSPYDLAAFVMKHHGGLDDEDTYFLASMKERFYWGSPSCVFDLHQLTILYHEAVGWQQATQAHANRP